MIFHTLLSAIGVVYLGFLIWKWLEKPKQQYQAPRVIREWILASITSDQKVWSACGRYAHSSGSTSGFLAGDLNELVRTTMGQKILDEMIECLKQQNLK
ncbi:hypothetical protein F889_01629 [Acinetobacter colistiniresistens]|uniref:Uncharacterized protein n=1 Tax=Acinetobacter colistiniresistens TaxID=280145 RepID=N9QWA4_9GAMM|nr:hypothetical protein [Acinetobacter colistiniresistens]ENX34351.1 hypothetical protein F889_01629 [Acinetobacter colistiniresistens]